MKNILKIIAAIIIMLGAIALYERHEDSERAEYAMAHDCTWTIQGSHDICK